MGRGARRGERRVPFRNQACTAKAWEAVTFKTAKKLGMVRDAFQTAEDAAAMTGNVGIAHVRYPTAAGGVEYARRYGAIFGELSSAHVEAPYLPLDARRVADYTRRRRRAIVETHP